MYCESYESDVTIASASHKCITRQDVREAYA